MNPGFEFLKNRGFSSKTIKEFMITYFDGKKLYGFPETLPFIDKIKLLLQPHFNDCVIIPVFDLYSRLVSIYVRRLNGKPKFDATSFKKTHTLYGFNVAYKYILDKDSVFIVEGVFDFLMAWQFGIKNIVSPLGCFFTNEQLCMCLRFTKNFNVLFDPDERGKGAARKVCELIKEHDGTYNNILLDRDLDEYLLKYGVSSLYKHVKSVSKI